MTLKLALLSIFLTLPIVGCHSTTATTPPAALAPGYSSQADQTLGQSLAAITAFRDQEKINYAGLSVTMQAQEKPYLNSLIDATNVANATYVAFHSGTATLAQAQSAMTAAQNAQTALTSNKEGK